MTRHQSICFADALWFRFVQAVFALAGGPVPVGALWLSKLTSLLPTVWLVGYYSQTLGHWNFRPTDPAVYKVAVDACTGTFELQATSLRKSLVVELQASTDGFVPLHCPTAKGFQIESVESFSGHARVEAYVYQLWPWKERGWKLVEVTEFGNAALEFGGSYRCQQDSGLLDEHHLCTADA